MLGFFLTSCPSIVTGCFSILPATELVPGDIVEVSGMLIVWSSDQS
jgi:hypothetical protein